MNEIWLVMIRFLYNQEGWVTSFSLSAFLNISVRTVKNYIWEINSQSPGLIESSRSGFRLTGKAKAISFMQSVKANQMPQTVKDRQKVVLKKLLLETNEYPLEALAKELFITVPTLNKELPRLKEELNDYELVFRTRQGIAFIEGAETNKKKLLSKLIYEESESGFLSLKQMQKHLPNYDLSLVREIVQTALHSHHYFVDDFSLLNIVLHIGIMLERKSGVPAPVKSGIQEWDTAIQGHVREIVEAIAVNINKHFSADFTDGEQHDLSLIVMTRAISMKITEVDYRQLSTFIEPDILELVQLMQQKTKEVFGITITNPDFTVRFSLHIRNLLLRLQHGVILRNPQMKGIKNSYPFIYDTAVFNANLITKTYGFVLSEDEISYIALHIGVLLEERKLIKNEVRTILLVPQYNISNHSFVERFKEIFQDHLHITGMISSEDELDDFLNYDLLVTTIEMEELVAKPTVRISFYLSNKDILLVTKKVEEVLSDRLKNKVEDKLRTMFKKELFFYSSGTESQEQVIDKMTEALQQNDFADKSFRARIFEREQVSSSAYLNIAMPHPLEMCAIHSGIAVSIHANPVDWKGTPVNLVFMLAIHQDDSLFFKDIFEFITEIIAEEKKLRVLLECKTFEGFISVLVDFAK